MRGCKQFKQQHPTTGVSDPECVLHHLVDFPVKYILCPRYFLIQVSQNRESALASICRPCTVRPSAIESMGTHHLRAGTHAGRRPLNTSKASNPAALTASSFLLDPRRDIARSRPTRAVRTQPIHTSDIYIYIYIYQTYISSADIVARVA